MKILIVINGNGNFKAAHPTDRPRVINMIKSISNGDYFNSVKNDNAIKIKSDLSFYCCKDWNDLINNFIQKGFLEYVDLSDSIPIGCICSSKKSK